jgi:hypothetical protein
MHDIGRSGWSWVYIFLPVIGWILILKWLTKEGNPEANRYGPPDNGTNVAESDQAYKAWQESTKSPAEFNAESGESDLDESEIGQGVKSNGKMRRMRRNK